MVTECDEEFLRKVADIVGSSAAADAALKERNRRREKGEDAAVYWDRDKGVLFVGPRIS